MDKRWLLVPVEPTAEMIEAIQSVIDSPYNPANKAEKYQAQHAYKAMLAAAPAQPEQEPTKEMIDAAERIDWADSDVRGNIVNMWQAMLAAPPAAHPPQRTWVGLTDEELNYLLKAKGPWNMSYAPRIVNLARAIEQRLKEKNNG